MKTVVIRAGFTLIILIGFIWWAGGCNGAAQAQADTLAFATPFPTPIEIDTPSPTPTATATATATATETATATATETTTATTTATATETTTATATVVSTAPSTSTRAIVDNATETPTETPVDTVIPTLIPTIPSATATTTATPASCGQIPLQECHALVTLFNETSGVLWRYRSGWLQNAQACTWYGVTCAVDDTGQLHVQRLNLAWNKLQGALPALLQQLPQLEVLDLSGNQLTGPIPQTLGELDRLTVLNLSENAFSGQVPAALGRLAKLEVLHLFENGLFGLLPIELSELSLLQNFKYQNTRLCTPTETGFQTWLNKIYLVTRPAINDCKPLVTTPKPLVLIYAALDNNLGTERWEALVNAVEAGTHDGVNVRLLIDGTGPDNSFQYDIQTDTDPTCPSLVTGNLDCNRYRLRFSRLRANENTADRDVLANFITNSMLEYSNAPQTILVLVGHGSGWGASVLPSQPYRGWTPQSSLITDTMGGMLWDESIGLATPGMSSLSTRGLGEALRGARQAAGRSIDLLYLDACSMAMTEVAFEVKDSVKYLLASQNIKLAVFPYDQLLRQVGNGRDGKSLGEKWLTIETDILQANNVQTYTFSLSDLSQMDDLATATTNVVDALRSVLPARLTSLRQALAQSAHFDSDYDGSSNLNDSFIDLGEFATQIETLFADQPAIVTAAQTLHTSVDAAVVESKFRGQTPGALAWDQLGGLSIYLPFAIGDEGRSALYNPTNLRWATSTTWDELLVDWQQANALTPPATTSCTDASQCEPLVRLEAVSDAQGIQTPRQIFIPLVIR